MQWSDQKAEQAFLVCGFFSCVGGAVTEAVDYFGTARLRLGAAYNRALFYVTGGAAWTHVSLTVAGFGSANGNGVGWTAGGGLELAATDNLSLKLEYMFIDTPSMTLTASGVTSNSFEVKDSIVRVGLNVRFPTH